MDWIPFVSSTDEISNDNRKRSQYIMVAISVMEEAMRILVETRAIVSL